MKEYKYKIFVINPGSTSTKLALFHDNNKIIETSVTHDASVMNSFKDVNDQLGYRMGFVHDFIENNERIFRRIF